MDDIRLNLGCGEKRLEGYVNVDKYGSPDLLCDLEAFPWPWPDNSVSEVLLIHVLEHLGQATDVYLGIIKELYRICRAGAMIKIVVPHYRHQFFHDDPTHVRVVTPLGLQLFSQRLNREWAEAGAANSPLGMYLGVDLEIRSLVVYPSTDWFRLHPEPSVDMELLEQESRIYNNLIEQYEISLEVIK